MVISTKLPLKGAHAFRNLKIPLRWEKVFNEHKWPLYTYFLQTLSYSPHMLRQYSRLMLPEKNISHQNAAPPAPPAQTYKPVCAAPLPALLPSLSLSHLTRYFLSSCVSSSSGFLILFSDSFPSAFRPHTNSWGCMHLLLFERWENEVLRVWVLPSVVSLVSSRTRTRTQVA